VGFLCNNYIYFTNYLLLHKSKFQHEYLLEVNKVVKQYGDYVALNEVSLTVLKQYLWTLGPNGAGKHPNPNHKSNYAA
jgi:ABC-type molybdenum transport system ATPase subunit/photorepair protein PhrA